MVICKRRINREEIEIKIGPHKIQKVSAFKYLGLIIDEKHTFANQAQSVHARIKNVLTNLNVNSKYFDERIMYITVNALIMSVFNYNIDVYYGHLNNERKTKLNKLFKRCVESISNYEDTIRKYKIMDLDQRNKYFTSIYIYKEVKSNSYKFVFNTSNYSRRKENQIKLPKFRKNIGLNSVFYAEAKLFNDIQTEIKNLDEIERFKKSLKDNILKDT